MPPKKEASAAGAETIVGFEPRETKLLAAAFVASTAPGKFDYDLMATLTGNTAGSLKKMLPPIKNKAAEAHPSFATFVGASGEGSATKPASTKANAAKKRKADDDKQEDKANASDGKEQSAPKARGRGRNKKTKTDKEANGGDIESKTEETDET